MEELFLNGVKYKGNAAYINGFNGYTKTKDDSVLCAIINNSLWNEQGEPNYLKDCENKLVHNKNLRGKHIII